MNTLTDEKTKAQEQLTQLTAQLEQANATSTALQAEKDKLAIELEAAKSDAGKPQEAKKEEAPNENEPKEEDKKEEDKKEVSEAKPAEAA